MKECPFCGADYSGLTGGQLASYPTYDCWTIIGMGGNAIRGSKCYETQLTQQAELLRQALGVLMRIEYDKELSPGPFCDLHTDVRSLIPALEKALEKAK